MGAPSYRPPPLSDLLVHASPQCIRTTKRERERERERPRANTTNHEQQPPERRTTTKKKKKAGAGQRLGVGADLEVRVVEGERVRQEENTRGTPNPPSGGFGFPQRLREREDKRKHGGDETNQTQKRGPHTKTKHGSGLEGLKNQTRAQPQRQKNAKQTADDKTETTTEE